MSKQRFRKGRIMTKAERPEVQRRALFRRLVGPAQEERVGSARNPDVETFLRKLKRFESDSRERRVLVR
jgi:hypothetical protein